MTGTFTLRSGQVASIYFVEYLFEADPELLAAIAAHMARLVPEATEVVAGLELGGVPVATAISLATGIPATFVRKDRRIEPACGEGLGVGALRPGRAHGQPCGWIFSSAVEQLSLQICCGEPSQDGPGRSTGARWDGYDIPIGPTPPGAAKAVPFK